MANNGNINGTKASSFEKLSMMVKSRSFKESAGYTAAEFVSAATSLGVVGVADVVAPGMLASAGKNIAHVPAAAAALDFVDGLLNKFCKLDECKPDPDQSKQQRREFLAKTLTVFGVAWVASMASKLGTRRVLNKLNDMGDGQPWWKPNKHDGQIALWDEGIHYGSLILFNTGLAKHTDDAIRSTSKILRKTTGMSEKKAHEIASMAMIWEAPNALGWMAGLYPISKQNNHDWGFNKPASHVEQMNRRSTDRGLPPPSK